jgi:hypothetical protein
MLNHCRSACTSGLVSHRIEHSLPQGHFGKFKEFGRHGIMSEEAGGKGLLELQDLTFADGNQGFKVC